MSFTILTTPAAIWDAVSEPFLSLRYKGNVSEDGTSFSMELSLAGGNPIVINSAVDREKMIAAIRSFSGDIFLYISNQQSGERPSIDTTRFSISAPLSDWKPFQRTWYERKGSRCLDVLMAYLSGVDEESALQTLKQLGLAPKQIALDCVDSDLAYFLDLIGELDTKPHEVNERVMIRLQERYPVIYPIIYHRREEKLLRRDGSY